MSRNKAFWRLGVILLLYFFLGLAHSLWLPLGSAPDEIDHFLYTRFIARYGRLPLDADEREQAGRKAYLPALYHGLNAAVVSWSYTLEPPRLKFLRESPRFDLARALFHTEHLVNTADELPPYQGQVLMWHLARAVSILWGVGIILIAYITALEIFPGRYRLAVIAAALTAFIPTFIFISASISYEPLVAFIAGLYFLVLVKIVKGDTRLKLYIWLGLLLGLSVTVKYVTVILPIQVIVVVAYLAWRQGWGWWGWFQRVALTGGAAMLAASWWFLFLAINFNSVTDNGWVVGLLSPIIAGGTDTTQNYTASLLTGGEIGVAADEIINRPAFTAWAWRTFHTFWVEPIGDNYPLGFAAPLLIGGVCLVSGWGLTRAWRLYPSRRVWIALFVGQLFLFLVFPFLRYLVQGELSHTAQGRHVLFPLATTLPLLFIYGWQGWLSSKTQRWLALAVVGGLVSWNLVQLIHIATCCAAPLPVRTTTDAVAHIPLRIDQKFGQNIILVGYESQVRPEINALRLSLYWQSPTYPEEDYQLLIELAQEDQTKLRWLAYPTNGRYPTRIWENWETITDEWFLPLSDMPPGRYQVQLQLRGFEGPLKINGTDKLTLTQIAIPEVPSVEPGTPLSVTVEGREVIKGLTLWDPEPYRQLDRFVYQPRMTIPFVWQGQPGEGEVVKWLMVDEAGKTYPARSGAAHFFYFMVEGDWPPGDYRLRAEVWRDETVVASSEIASGITIFNKQPRLMDPPPISNPLEANFANRVKLLGYDLETRAVASDQPILLTLYWQGLRTMAHDYTFVTKILAEQQEFGSVERYAKDGYKTTHWFAGEVVVDQFAILPDRGTPPGVYWLDASLYVGLNQTVIPLPLMLEGQPADVTSVTFGPVKIGGPPPGIVAAEVLPEHQLDIKLGQVIRLLGYDLMQAGQDLIVTLYWESLAPIDTNQTVFLHVRDETGQTIAQIDRPPVNGAYPTLLWESGEIIPDELHITLPAGLPPGNYSIVAGMYNFVTGVRLPIDQSPDDSATLLVMELR